MLAETTVKPVKTTEMIQKNDTTLLVTKLFNTIRPTLQQIANNLSDLKGNEENQEMFVETTEITIKSTENVNSNEEMSSDTVNIINNNNNNNIIITTASENASNQEECEGSYQKSMEFCEGTTHFLKEDPLEVTEKPVETTTNNWLDITEKSIKIASIVVAAPLTQIPKPILEDLSLEFKPSLETETVEMNTKVCNNTSHYIEMTTPIVEITTQVLTNLTNSWLPIEEMTTQLMKIKELKSLEQTTEEFIKGTDNNSDTLTTTEVTTTTTQNINMGYDILKRHYEICGSFLGRRISFANKTTLMQYPWSALLVYNTTERFHCGGTLITSKYVLTAAHCVNQYFYPLVAVRIGEHNISSILDCDFSLTYEKICAERIIDAGIEEIIIHKEFNRLTLKNDIAMLRLNQVIEFTRSHYPICLPKINEDLRTYRATITGWGATEKSLRSDILMEADIPVLDISKCQQIYRSRRFDDDREICASGVNEVDVCKGDSGGPLFTRTLRDGKTRCVQMGITSLGVATCGDNRYLPALFTRVSYYISWIAQNLKT